MPSKQVTDRSRSAGIVGTNAETYATEVGARTSAQLSPFLQAGEAVPDTALLLRLLARFLASKSTALDAADSAHEAEISDDAKPRAERDEAEVEARETVIEFRNAVSAKYGDVGLHTLGIYEPPPRGAPELAKYGRALHGTLIDGRRTLTSSGRRGVNLDRAEMAAELLVVVERLEAALRVVAQEASELHLTQTAKDRAFEENDRVFGTVARVAEGLLALAGRGDLADRVRPSRRRPGVTEAEEVSPTEG
jgi:hypothetical protein